MPTSETQWNQKSSIGPSTSGGTSMTSGPTFLVFSHTTLYIVVVFAVRNSDFESMNSSNITTVWFSGPNPRMPLRMAESEAAGMAVRIACTPRWKSRLSKTFSRVALSGKPSLALNVPSRVLTSAGAVIPAGISVAYLGLSAACATPLGVRNATPRNARRNATPRNARPRKTFVFMKNFVILVLLSNE